MVSMLLSHMYTHVPAVLNGIRCGDQIISSDRCGDHHCAHARKLRTTAHVIARMHTQACYALRHTHIYACVLLAVHKLEPCGQLIVVQHHDRVLRKPVIAACILEQPSHAGVPLCCCNDDPLPLLARGQWSFQVSANSKWSCLRAKWNRNSNAISGPWPGPG